MSGLDREWNQMAVLPYLKTTSCQTSVMIREYSQAFSCFHSISVVDLLLLFSQVSNVMRCKHLTVVSYFSSRAILLISRFWILNFYRGIQQQFHSSHDLIFKAPETLWLYQTAPEGETNKLHKHSPNIWTGVASTVFSSIHLPDSELANCLPTSYRLDVSLRCDIKMFSLPTVFSVLKWSSLKHSSCGKSPTLPATEPSHNRMACHRLVPNLHSGCSDIITLPNPSVNH